ncbi:DUF2752 domain-containing protein [Pontiellaceae bacterium B1224]|nr:DUF2752 domain-containing protein [Pontiellaceae bacterium B1224]
MSDIWKRCTVVALIGVAAFLLWWMHPEENKVIPQCLVLKHTGFYCSGCGSLRAIHFLLQGEFSNAWTMNPLTVLLLPGLFILAGAELIFNRHDISTRIRPAYLWALIVIFILFGILRNLPVYPFTLLAPH